ncbi:MAG: hypothetical protein ACR2KK_11095 [Acidimicrobiales bacterium]
MTVVLLLASIWAVILVPPALRAHAARKEAFLISFGEPVAAAVAPFRPPRPPSQPIQRRRRIAGGLLVAMVVTLLVGLLPTFRAVLVVHLFLVDFFLAYIALLAHMADRAARARVATRVEAVAPAAAAAPAPDRPNWRRRRVSAPVGPILPELRPSAPLG